MSLFEQQPRPAQDFEPEDFERSRRIANTTALKIVGAGLAVGLPAVLTVSHYAMDNNSSISDNTAYKALGIDQNEFKSLKNGRNSLVDAQKDITSSKLEDASKELVEAQVAFVGANRLELEQTTRGINTSLVSGQDPQEVMITIDNFKGTVGKEITSVEARVDLLTQPHRSQAETLTFAGSVLAVAAVASAVSAAVTRRMVQRSMHRDA